ncbi:fimbrial chaperone [Stenotrophomonas sepilia]|uniref:Fimbrial chaperone n=1 Tax=Stenotrophomonas sepilia TaxID=2860290 RepID=A0ABQ6QFF0_9GAMM|nr:fimbrial chaperone [Stenotrophomonas sepilia]
MTRIRTDAARIGTESISSRGNDIMCNFKRNLLAGVLFTLGAVSAFQTQAAVTMMGTRIVFPGDQSEVSVRLQNVGETPSLVQAWIDDGDVDAAPSASKVPFIVRPPMFRINGGKSQVIRIATAGAMLPGDRESLFGFNVLDVPAQAAKQAGEGGATLQLVVRTRVKMFYRPKGLSRAAAAKAPTQLQWQVTTGPGAHGLRVTNPTPYHVIVKKVASAGIAVDEVVVAPLSHHTYALSPQQHQALKESITFEYAVTDTGVVVAAQAPLSLP